MIVIKNNRHDSKFENHLPKEMRDCLEICRHRRRHEQRRNITKIREIECQKKTLNGHWLSMTIVWLACICLRFTIRII